MLAQDETVSCHGNAGDGWDSHYDADYSYTDWPWYRFADKVTRLIISPGITEIGEDAFRGYSKLEALEIGIIREVQRLSPEQQANARSLFTPSEYNGQHGNYCIMDTIKPSPNGVATIRLNEWAHKFPCFVTMSLLNLLEQYLQSNPASRTPLTLRFEVQGTFSFPPDLSLFRRAVALLYPGVHVK